ATVTVDLTVNQRGRVTTTGSGGTRTSRQYDPLGRAVVERQISDGRIYASATTYGCPQAGCAASDQGTVVKTLTYTDGETATYGYDRGGAPKPLTSSSGAGVTGIHRNARGQTTEVDYANGTVTKRTYNDATDLRLQQIKTTIGSTGPAIQQVAYGYDAN